MLEFFLKFHFFGCLHKSVSYTTNPTGALRLDENEWEQLIGTAVHMSVLNLPRSIIMVRERPVPMSREGWEETKDFIHFSENMTPNNAERLFQSQATYRFTIQSSGSASRSDVVC